MELVTYQFIELLCKRCKKALFSPFLKCYGLIFKFFHSKNMNKKLKFGEEMCIIRKHI